MGMRKMSESDIHIYVFGDSGNTVLGTVRKNRGNGANS